MNLNLCEKLFYRWLNQCYYQNLIIFWNICKAADVWLWTEKSVFYSFFLGGKQVWIFCSENPRRSTIFADLRDYLFRVIVMNSYQSSTIHYIQPYYIKCRTYSGIDISVLGTTSVHSLVCKWFVHLPACNGHLFWTDVHNKNI